MINILFITYTHSNGGGAESLLTSYVNKFDKNKYKITIFEIERFNVKKEPIDDNVILKKLPLYFNNSKDNIFYAYTKYINRKLLYFKPEILRSLFNLNGFDIVITWNYQLPSFMLAAFPESYKIGFFHSSIYDLQDTLQNRIKDNDLLIKRINQIKAYEKANILITISKKSFDSLCDTFPEFKEKCLIINNGIDSEIVRFKAQQKLMIQLNNQRKHICCCGRLVDDKNFELVIYALSIVLKEYTNVDLIIIGTGEKEIYLRDLVKKLNLNEYVIFAGYQNNPFPLIQNCDIFALSSYVEGFPMVIMEAMSLGKPFVTTKVSGASEELLNDEKCGLLADWDSEDYAKKLLRLLQNEDLYNTMSNNCLTHIENFSLKKTTEKFEQIFDYSNIKTKINTNNDFKNLIKYILFFIFYFNVSWFKKNVKKNKLKSVLYLIGYIVSVFFLPIKIFYSILYITKTRKI